MIFPPENVAMRQDTHLESEGAEFLVLGYLLTAGIQAYKAYTNAVGHDIIVAGPFYKRSATIQVKSRWRTGARSVIVKQLKSDFLVIVKLNRGSKDGKAKVLPPEFYVIPSEKLACLDRKGWGQIFFKAIENLAEYREGWNQIKTFVKSEGAEQQAYPPLVS